SGLVSIPWDGRPYVKNWLEQAMTLPGGIVSPLDLMRHHGDFVVPCLERSQIGPTSLYDMLEGRQVVGMPLFTHHGPIGLLSLVRTPDAPPFGASDWEQMLTVGLRLALHAQDLRSRWRAHDRSSALRRLREAIGRESKIPDIWRQVVDTVHEVIFDRIQGLHGAAQMPPPSGIDPLGRTSLRRMEADRSLGGWGRGFGVPEGQNRAVELDSLTTRKTRLIGRVFDSGAESFHTDIGNLEGYEPPVAGAVRSLILVPILANGVCIAALAVGHGQPGFFGQSPEQSADLQFLRECASMLGTFMAQLRNAHLQAGALDLLLELARGEGAGLGEKEWIAQVVRLLDNHAVGCAGVLWLKPPTEPEADGPWQIGQAWCFDPGSQRLAAVAPAEQPRWQGHINRHWPGSYCARTSSTGHPQVNFTTADFICDQELTGVEIRAQLNLRIALSRNTSTLAMLVLLFAVPAPIIVTPQHREFLERLAKLCAVYLQDRQHLVELADWKTLAEHNQAWQAAYQQLRHQLRSQIAEIDDRLGDTIDDLRRGQDPAAALRGLREDMRRDFASVVSALNTSAALTRPLQREWLSLSAVAERALAGVQRRAESLGAAIRLAGPLTHWQVNSDSDLLHLALVNLMDNALDEFVLQLAEPARRTGRPPRVAGGPPLLEIRWALAGERLGGDAVPAPCLLVRDNGPGVAPDMVERLFGGVSNKAQGSGFQLRFTRDALARQGWQLDFRPVAGEPGACFAIIPAHADVRESEQWEN
ncbi:MAG TPA: GAF domain-containing sensor histidine kinase, partial [Rhodocyclaceae bacterium]|nr:GAF domain-containing sensor histidine kinase [Rhodocyclaceae bacterium]